VSWRSLTRRCCVLLMLPQAWGVVNAMFRNPGGDRSSPIKVFLHLFMEGAEFFKTVPHCP
jgi:hypothetical protein